jgi:NAD-dependent SIR2 family protein deacetylase
MTVATSDAPLVDEAVELLRGRTIAVLTGAGVSTDSGIPDYRGEGAPVRSPMTFQTFLDDERARKRYWAGSHLGWTHFSAAEPNAGHRALAALELDGPVNGVITQNVDGLHQRAGSGNVVELHGSLAQVVCLRCGRRESRSSVQFRMQALNPDLLAADVKVLPDGDADVPDELVTGFKVPACLYCGGMLKADVVFFGENVPRPRVQRAFQLLTAANALLVLGSSLAVRSGYRFVATAAEEGKPVAIVNHGPSRGDGDADVRLEGRLGQVLPELARRLI